MTRHYLVTYDISNELRLRRVHAIARDFAQPVQYSVFLAQLRDTQKAEFKRRLAHVVHAQEDQVLFFDLGRVHGRHEIDLPAHEAVGRPLHVHTRRIVVI